MDRHERALIDTGEATPSRKQLQAYTSKMSGPIGLTRSQILNIKFHHLYCISIGSIILKTRECQKHSTSIESIALSKAYSPILLVIRDIQGILNNKPTTCI